MKYRPTRCRYCSRQADVDVKISRKGLCQDCARVRIEQNAEAMITQTGPLYDEWVQRWQAGRAEWVAFVEALHGQPPAT